MDPDETWKDILYGMGALSTTPGREDTRECLVQDLRNLADWLEKGGFPPEHEHAN